MLDLILSNFSGSSFLANRIFDDGALVRGGASQTHVLRICEFTESTPTADTKTALGTMPDAWLEFADIVFAETRYPVGV